MSARNRRFSTHAAAGLAGLMMVVAGPRPGLAQEMTEMSAASKVAAVERSLQITQQTGRPTVVVATSRAIPQSHRVYEALLRLPKAKELGQIVQFAELPAESSPALTERLRIKDFPTVLVFRRGARGPELIGREDGANDAFDAVGYLCTLSLDARTGGKVDPALMRTNHWHHQAAPSAQSIAPTPQAVPTAPAIAPAAAPVMMAPAAPVVSAPASAPVVISSPSPSVVFQQSAPTIFVAPPQPPNIVIASAPAALPNVSVVQPSTLAVANQPQQLFLTASVPAAAPATAAVASVPVTMMAAAPVQAVAAPAQAVAAPAATSTLAGIPPGPLGRLIGNFGERLAKHKYPRVPGASTATILTQTAGVAAPASIPVSIPVSAPAAAPQQVYYTSGTAAPSGMPQPVAQPAPSPQYSAPSSQGFFHHQ